MGEAARDFHVFETAMGFCAIAWGEAGVVRFQLPTKSAEAAELLMRRRASCAAPGAPSEAVAAVVQSAQRYFAGEEMDFASVPVDLAGQDAFFAGFMAPCAASAGAPRRPMARWRRRLARGPKRRATLARRWREIRPH
jgi:methylated-DNA-[protein]-cysteine S-methyltransferase